MTKCFMGDCKKLQEDHPDRCLDTESQEGKWGKCHEFEPQDAGQIKEGKSNVRKLLLHSIGRRSTKDLLELLDIRCWHCKCCYHDGREWRCKEGHSIFSCTSRACLKIDFDDDWKKANISKIQKGS